MKGEQVPAVGWRLVFFACVLSTCYAPSKEPEQCQARQVRQAHALCIPEPEPGAEMRGRATDEWSPDCRAGETPAPCELGVVCLESMESCSCECDVDHDCQTMSLGVAAHGGPEGRSSECVDGRCVWGQT